MVVYNGEVMVVTVKEEERLRSFKRTIIKEMQTKKVDKEYHGLMNMKINIMKEKDS